MRLVYTGLLIGFCIASFMLSSAGGARFIIPLAIFIIAAWIAVRSEEKD